MDAAHRTDDEQARRWNGLAGQAWVEEQDLLDQVFKPFEALLIEAISAGSARHVLDVGCGTGGTTLAVARRLGESGRVVGLDISDPMLAAARARAERDGVAARFVRANAQHHPFASASFDTIISRFGVMFFDDPVEAFANLRHAVQANGTLRFIAWRSAADNPFMTTAERAAAPLLPNLPPRRPGAPGQFAFGERDLVDTVLRKSGWTELDIRPLDVTCMLPEAELVRYLTRLGPVGTALREVDDQIRRQVVEIVRAAFEPYVHGADVRFTAACWMVGARTRASSAASRGAAPPLA